MGTNATMDGRSKTPRYCVLVVTDGSAPLWERTRFYSIDPAVQHVDIPLSTKCVSKLVVFRFAPPCQGDSLSRVCVFYLQPPHLINSVSPKKTNSASQKIFLDGVPFALLFLNEQGAPYAFNDVTAAVASALQADDNRAYTALDSAINRLTTTSDTENLELAPLAHWMRCFSLEQPADASPTIVGSGLPMARAVDPELIAESLPQALEVACSISPKLRHASKRHEIGLLFGLILRAFAGQYVTEKQDDRSLVTGMFSMHGPWDCDDMSLMGMTVYNAMQHISPGSEHVVKYPVLRRVLDYAQNTIDDVLMVQGRAQTPQGSLEGHVWLLFRFCDGSCRYFEATTCSSLTEDEYAYAKLPVSCDADSAMAKGIHTKLSPSGECGVIGPISSRNYRGVQAISPDAAYILRTQDPDTGAWKLGVTPTELESDSILTELCKVEFTPNEANRIANRLIIGYPRRLFGKLGPSNLAKCIEATGVGAPTPICPPPGTFDVGVPGDLRIFPSLWWRIPGRQFYDMASSAHA